MSKDREQHSFTTACEYGDGLGSLGQKPFPSQENGYSYPAMAEIIRNITLRVSRTGSFKENITFKDSGETLHFDCTPKTFKVQTLDCEYYMDMERTQVLAERSLSLPESYMLQGQMHSF